jgi:hypothetical protein
MANDAPQHLTMADLILLKHAQFWESCTHYCADLLSSAVAARLAVVPDFT